MHMVTILFSTLPTAFVQESKVRSRIRIVRSYHTLSKLANDTLYSVMHPDGNSFIGEVVLDSFNMSYRDEDSISDQKYRKQIVCAF